MDLEQLVTFCKVAELKSFTRAARELNVTQPSVTGRIRSLESALGQSLLARRGRSIELTAAGAVFLPFAQRSVLVFREGVEALEQSHRKAVYRLKIGATPLIATLDLPGILRHFWQLQPFVDVKLRTGHPPEVASLLLDRVIEAGLITMPVDHPAIESRNLHADPIVFVVSEEHPLARREGMRIADLKGQDFVGFDRRYAGHWAEVEDALLEHGVSIHYRSEVDNVEAAKQQVLGSGLISAFPSRAVEQEIQQGKMRALTFQDDPNLSMVTRLIVRKGSSERPLHDFLQATMARRRQRAPSQPVA